jgi:hypothetical protein
MPTRAEFAAAIQQRLECEFERLQAAFASATPTRHFVVDELLFAFQAPGVVDAIACASSGGDYRHVTTFAGRPGEPLKRAVLAVDAAARNTLGRVFPGLLRHGPHRRSSRGTGADS